VEFILSEVEGLIQTPNELGNYKKNLQVLRLAGFYLGVLSQMPLQKART
jgi:hypothetical protein